MYHPDCFTKSTTLPRANAPGIGAVDCTGNLARKDVWSYFSVHWITLYDMCDKISELRLRGFWASARHRALWGKRNTKRMGGLLRALFSFVV